MEELTSKLNGDQWQPRPAGASQKAQKEASEGRTVIAGTLHPSESAQGNGAESTPATVRFAAESPVVPSLGTKLTAMQSAASSDSFGSSPRRQVGAEEPADLKGADKAFMSQLAGSSIGGAILTAAGRLFSPRSHPPPRQQSSGTPPASAAGAACSVQPTHATPEEVAAEIAASQSVAAVAIQACARGMLGRRRLARLASAALLSQRRWRWQRERVAILQLQQAARLLLMRRRAEVEQGLDAALSSGAAGRRHHRHSLLELERVVKTDTDLLKHSGARTPPPPLAPCVPAPPLLPCPHPLHPRTSPAPLLPCPLPPPILFPDSLSCVAGTPSRRCDRAPRPHRHRGCDDAPQE